MNRFLLPEIFSIYLSLYIHIIFISFMLIIEIGMNFFYLLFLVFNSFYIIFHFTCANNRNKYDECVMQKSHRIIFVLFGIFAASLRLHSISAKIRAQSYNSFASTSTQLS